MKSIAPFFMVETAIGTSPWPVTKMIGSAALSAIRRSCNSRPLMPDIRTSRIRQAIWPACRAG